MIALFFKAIARHDDRTGDLFTQPINVKGYTRSDGTVVKPHTAKHKKRVAIVSAHAHNKAIDQNRASGGQGQEKKMDKLVGPHTGFKYEIAYRNEMGGFYHLQYTQKNGNKFSASFNLEGNRHKTADEAEKQIPEFDKELDSAINPSTKMNAKAEELKLQYESGEHWLNGSDRGDLIEMAAKLNGITEDEVIQKLLSGEEVKHRSGWDGVIRSGVAYEKKIKKLEEFQRKEHEKKGSELKCKSCGQTGHAGSYPFSTLPGSGLCDDCV